MNQHRYILEKYKDIDSRYDCPSCRKRKEFTRYIDTETGEHIDPSVGICNRQDKCGYHYPPRQYLDDNRLFLENKKRFPFPRTRGKKQETRAIKSISTIPLETFKASLQHDQHEANHFIRYLLKIFGKDVTEKSVARYFIGTSKHWTGSTVFWQVDIRGRIRAGKVMLYNPDTGKRVKKHINWTHSILKIKDFNLSQCFFGEHLIKQEPTKPVAIVESEKTAIIASIYLPKFIWLACGSLTNLTAEKCKAIKGRQVFLFPDLNGFQKWSHKALELSGIASFKVSDLLERKAMEDERAQGLDLADYLIRFDYRTFIKPDVSRFQPIREGNKETEPEPFPALSYNVSSVYDTGNDHITDSELKELEQKISALRERGLPKVFQLDAATKITDVEKFLSSHMEVIKSRQAFEPALQRLIKFISLN